MECPFAELENMTELPEMPIFLQGVHLQYGRIVGTFTKDGEHYLGIYNTGEEAVVMKYALQTDDRRTIVDARRAPLSETDKIIRQKGMRGYVKISYRAVDGRLETVKEYYDIQ